MEKAKKKKLLATFIGNICEEKKISFNGYKSRELNLMEGKYSRQC